MRSLSLGICYLLCASIALAAPGTKLVPVFDQHLPGVNNSIWQSEVRLYNPTSLPQVVFVARVFPYGATACTGLSPVTIPAGALVQLRSFGCPNGAAAVELSLDDAINVDSVITNTGGFQQDPCCLSGYSQNVPVATPLYARDWTVANLQVPLSTGQILSHLGRHNLGLLNPNDVSASVTLRYFNANGQEDLLPFLNLTHTHADVPPRTLIQVNDLLPYAQADVTFQPQRGYWRVLISATSPIYVYDSYVDNATNDATTIVAVPSAP